MPPTCPSRGLIAALTLLAGPALAGAAEDCRDLDIPAAESIAPCTQAIAAEPDAAERADLLLWRGSAYKAIDDYDRARADFAKARSLRPDWADPHIEEAFLLQRAGDDEGAIAAAQRGLEAEPTSAFAARTILSLMGDAGRFEDCIAFAPRAFEVVPGDPEVLGNLARCKGDAGDAEAGAAGTRRAIESGLDTAWGYGNLSVYLRRLGRPAEAVDAARRAVQIDPAYVGGQRALVSALVETGQPDAAIEAYRRADPQDPADRMHLANDLAWGLHLAGLGAQALPFAEDAVTAMNEAGEPVAAVIDTHAHALAAAGRADEAADAYLRAAELDPGLRSAYVASLARLGFDAESVGLAEALRACLPTGPACGL